MSPPQKRTPPTYQVCVEITPLQPGEITKLQRKIAQQLSSLGEILEQYPHFKAQVQTLENPQDLLARIQQQCAFATDNARRESKKIPRTAQLLIELIPNKGLPHKRTCIL